MESIKKEKDIPQSKAAAKKEKDSKAKATAKDAAAPQTEAASPEELLSDAEKASQAEKAELPTIKRNRESPQWRVLYTKSRSEMSGYNRLKDAGFSVYLPRVTKESPWSDRTKQVVVPMFKSYIFIRSLESELEKASHDDAIHHIVRFAEKPATVRDEEIVIIRAVEAAAREVDVVDHSVQVGAAVRIRYGKMKGLIGTLTNFKSGQRVAISIESLNMDLMVDVPLCDIRLIKNKAGDVGKPISVPETERVIEMKAKRKVIKKEINKKRREKNRKLKKLIERRLEKLNAGDTVSVEMIDVKIRIVRREAKELLEEAKRLEKQYGIKILTKKTTYDDPTDEDIYDEIDDEDDEDQTENLEIDSELSEN